MSGRFGGVGEWIVGIALVLFLTGAEGCVEWFLR